MSLFNSGGVTLPLIIHNSTKFCKQCDKIASPHPQAQDDQAPGKVSTDGYLNVLKNCLTWSSTRLVTVV